jgi:hypothetical protein
MLNITFSIFQRNVFFVVIGVLVDENYADLEVLQRFILVTRMDRTLHAYVRLNISSTSMKEEGSVPEYIAVCDMSFNNVNMYILWFNIFPWTHMQIRKCQLSY